MDNLFETKFVDHPLYEFNSTNFCLEIEKKVKYKKVNYIEAVTELANEYELDPKEVAKLITPTMKEKMEIDATKLHLLKI
jgi:hypothetical protein